MNARDVALKVLKEADRRREFAADALERELEDDRISALDRSLATAIVYATVRHRGTIDRILDKFSNVPTEGMEPEMRWILRIAACQLLFLEKVPAYAALNEAAEMAKRHRDARAAGFVTGVLRALQRSIVKIEPDDPPVDAKPEPIEFGGWGDALLGALEERWPDLDHRRLVAAPGGRRIIFNKDLWTDPLREPSPCLAGMFSYPAWLIARWFARLGAAATIGLLEAGNRHPELAIRPNPRKCTPAELVARLRTEGVEVEESPLHVRHTGALYKLPSFAEGWFSVQDDAAQRVVPLLDPQPGELIADLCAAPGGKAAQIAEGGARVIASDGEFTKVGGMAASFTRLALPGRFLAADARRPPFHPVFDAVLVDAPCSNTGVLARRVEARWRLRERDLAIHPRVQREILQAALRVVKPGGRVVYSTCSVEEEENGALVRDVIREGNGLKMEGELRILPGAKATCGGYAARIRVMGK